MRKLTVGEVRARAMQVAAEANTGDGSNCATNMEADLYKDVLEKIAREGNELAAAALQRLHLKEK